MRERAYPGPWRVFISDEGRVWIEETASVKRFVVADIPGDMETIEGAELANANLIAAAPDLQKFAQAVLLFHGTADWNLKKRMEWDNLTGCREATTKALCDFGRAVLKDATEGKEHVHE